MISSLRVEGFRCFRRFEMRGLGRVNLLVGANHSGKTSVLEALHLLCSAGDPNVLSQIPWRRGEVIAAPERLSSDQPVRFQGYASHLFFGHECRLGGRFELAADSRRLTVEVIPGAGGSLALHLSGAPKPVADQAIPLSPSMGLPDYDAYGSTSGASPVALLTTEPPEPGELVERWNRLVLTPQEGLVLEVLRHLDPDIERLAAQNVSYPAPPKCGFLVKRKGQIRPAPIGSMGDGMWRMLALAVALTQCQGGALLVDEIDTGLHHTVMSKMWSPCTARRSTWMCRFSLPHIAMTASMACRGCGSSRRSR